eukprot:11322865-Alexandrium_andersonii.AAC.1
MRTSRWASRWPSPRPSSRACGLMRWPILETTVTAVPPTYCNLVGWDERTGGPLTSRIDVVLLNRAAMQLAKSCCLVRGAAFPGHLGIRLVLGMQPFSTIGTFWAQPGRWNSKVE